MVLVGRAEFSGSPGRTQWEVKGADGSGEGLAECTETNFPGLPGASLKQKKFFQLLDRPELLPEPLTMEDQEVFSPSSFLKIKIFGF